MKRYISLILSLLFSVSQLFAQPRPPEDPGANPVPVGKYAALLLVIAAIVIFEYKDQIKKVFHKKKHKTPHYE
ncbi:MAG: hypothetical protein K9H26_11835 [Prolixibacteraceae bacterium]|nr:hypothetical protein [Prolixibacteraceae bacterium]